LKTKIEREVTICDRCNRVIEKNCQELMGALVICMWNDFSRSDFDVEPYIPLDLCETCFLGFREYMNNREKE